MKHFHIGTIFDPGVLAADCRPSDKMDFARLHIYDSLLEAAYRLAYGMPDEAIKRLAELGGALSLTIDIKDSQL